MTSVLKAFSQKAKVKGYRYELYHSALGITQIQVCAHVAQLGDSLKHQLGLGVNPFGVEPVEQRGCLRCDIADDSVGGVL